MVPDTTDDNVCPSWLRNLFQWYNNLHWGIKIGVGVAALIAAIGLTALSGGAIVPLLIGAGVAVVGGALCGGIIASALGGDFWDGAFDGLVEGVLWSGVFSLASASIGAIRRIPAYRFLRANGRKHSQVRQALRSFKGIPKVTTLQEDTVVYRGWGGKASESGPWVSPIAYGTEVRNLLSIPAVNTLEFTSTFLIPSGSRVLVGTVAPLFGLTGGGIQWWLPLWTLKF